nr:CGNR zinc finger domain-containing protein [uncultured Albidiferax sp.]
MPTPETAGTLGHLQQFVNTWSVPNDTRVATDLLPDLLGDSAAWNARFPFALGAQDSRAAMLHLRDDLRAAIADPSCLQGTLNPWLKKAGLGMAVEVQDELPVLHTTNPRHSAQGAILVIAMEAIARGDWTRLKCCADCQWCFFDTSKNRSKRWCGMSKGGPEGRACGTIAKVRSFRERQKGA